MAVSSSYSESRFNQNIEDLLSRLECREAALQAEKDQIQRVRKAADLQSLGMSSTSTTDVADPHEDDENGRTFGFYLAGRLASSIRLHVATWEHPSCPAWLAFPDHVAPMLDRGMILVDPTRIVMDESCIRAFPMLPYATIRLAWMACEHVSASHFLATAGPQNEAFYKRLFGHCVLSPARPCPDATPPLRLLAMNFQDERARILTRYPFLRSTERERQALFGGIWSSLHLGGRPADDWTPSFSLGSGAAYSTPPVA